MYNLIAYISRQVEEVMWFLLLYVLKLFGDKTEVCS